MFNEKVGAAAEKTQNPAHRRPGGVEAVRRLARGPAGLVAIVADRSMIHMTATLTRQTTRPLWGAASRLGLTKARVVTSSRWPLATSLGLGEGLGVDLIQDLELGDLHLLKRLAVALDLDLGGLLDPVEVFVVAESGFQLFSSPLEADDLGDQLDGQAALLVEERS